MSVKQAIRLQIEKFVQLGIEYVQIDSPFTINFGMVSDYTISTSVDIPDPFIFNLNLLTWETEFQQVETSFIFDLVPWIEDGLVIGISEDYTKFDINLILEATGAFIQVNGQVEIPWIQGTIFDLPNVASWDTTNTLDSDKIIPWGSTLPFDNDTTIAWIQIQILDINCAILWGHTQTIDIETEIPWALLSPFDFESVIPWEILSVLDKNITIPWENLTPFDLYKVIPWENLSPLDLNNVVPWVNPEAFDISNVIPWGQGTPLDVSIFTPFEPEPEVDPPPTGGVEIPWKQDYQGTVIMKQGVYLERYNEETQIWENVPLISCSTSIDINSWLWSFSAVLASRNAAMMVYPNTFNNGPVMVRLTVNKYRWLYYVEDVNHSYQYNQGSYNITGTSIAKQLGSPYNPTQTKIFGSAKQAAEIINEELTAYNAAHVEDIIPPPAWAAEWLDVSDWISTFTTNWNIPANTYGVADKTTIDIITEIVKTAGGFVQSVGGLDDSHILISDFQKLLIKPLYPIQPKKWASADPGDLAEELIGGTVINQSINWQPAPGYNFVIVGGQSGSYYKVRRQDSAADNIAQSIFEQLILSDNVARWRGQSVLDQQQYDKEIHTLTTVLPEYGSNLVPVLCFPGDLIEVTELHGTTLNTWRGQVIGTNVSVQPRIGVDLVLTVEKHMVS